MDITLSTDAGNAYLAEAAAELRKARDANDKRAGLAEELAAAKLPAREILAEVATRNMEIAEGFTRLAAIERNLPPCYHPARPEPGREPS